MHNTALEYFDCFLWSANLTIINYSTLGTYVRTHMPIKIVLP